MFEVLRPPAAPTMLFVGSYRLDEAHASPFLVEWSSLLRRHGVDSGNREVAVGPLSLDEAAQLVANVVGQDSDARRRAVQFHAESGGNPFLLVELAGCFDPDADAFRATDIHGVLAGSWARCRRDPCSSLTLSRCRVRRWSWARRRPRPAWKSRRGADSNAQARTCSSSGRRWIRTTTASDTPSSTGCRTVPDGTCTGGWRRSSNKRAGDSVTRISRPLRAARPTQAGERPWPAFTTSRTTTTRPGKLACPGVRIGGRRPGRAQLPSKSPPNSTPSPGGNTPQASAEIDFRIAPAGAGRPSSSSVVMMRRARNCARHSASTRPNDTADVRGLLGELAYKVGAATAESIAHFKTALEGSESGCLEACGAGLGDRAEIRGAACPPILPRRLHRGSPEPAADLANRLLGRLSTAPYNNNIVKLLWASLVGLNGAERLPRSPALAFNYVVHANDMSVFGWRRRAKQYYQAAIDLSRELNDEWGVARGSTTSLWASSRPGGITRPGEGRAREGRFHQARRRLRVPTLLPRRGLQPLRPRQSGGGGGGGPSDLRIGGAGRGQHVRDNRPAPLGKGHPRGTSFRRAGRMHSHRGRQQCLPFRYARGRVALASASRHTALAVDACEAAWAICKGNASIVAFNACVLAELVTSLRIHAEAIEAGEPREAEQLAPAAAGG